jgi:crossover junction endodeoxyribonuclease RuvC
MGIRQPGRTLGLDPGSQVTGVGILERQGTQFRYIYSGAIRLSQLSTLVLRLEKIHHRLREIIREFRPAEMAVEKVFLAKNVHSALILGHVRGVALLSAVEEGLELFEYSALEVKKAVTGYGRAEKNQVHSMVGTLIGQKLPRSQDVSDALAVAICHLNWFRPLS